MKKKAGVIVLIVAISILLVIIGMVIYGKVQMGKLPGLTFSEALEYTTQNNSDAVITVGLGKCVRY